ncbi:MAG: hypothetical protein LUH03_05190 [Oscillospiraceae bacterium]|nr:hypothetical protein [Oscillospiraceae bacterium]
MNKSKTKLVVDSLASKVTLIIGACVDAFSLLMIIVCFSDFQEFGFGFLLFCIIILAIGIWCTVVSRKNSKLISNFKVYVSAISTQGGFIPDLAASLNTSEDVVKKNLELMIKRGYFVNAYIDQNSNSIFVGGSSSPRTTPQSTNQTSSAPVTGQKLVSVKCSGCGGMNTIQEGQVGECEYCGSAIQG